ncbi:hypothetical protein D9R06_07340 [Kocuria marina subsp. indica]|nr:hypothetical protein B1B07_06880 [Kocuria indica]RLP57951.1 hypothetical protein D9R06_07340 [Kocuria indica]
MNWSATRCRARSTWRTCTRLTGGSTRTSGSGRGRSGPWSSTFLHPSRIGTAFNGIHETLRESGLLNDPSISDEDFIEQSSTLLAQVNYVHPFREGNGRTQRAYLDQIAALSGRTLSWRNIGRIENERASIRASSEGPGSRSGRSSRRS